MVKHFLCVVCKKKAKPRDRRPVPANVKKFLNRNFSISCSSNSVLCGSCRYKFYKTLKKPSGSGPVRVNERGDASSSYAPPSATERFTSPPSVTLKIPSASRSHSRCFVCKRPGPKLVCVPSEGRVSAFIKQNILVPADARCCPVHIVDEALTEDALSNVQTLTSTSFMNRSSICTLLHKMRTVCINQNSSLNFDDMEERDYPFLTGLNKAHFDDFSNHLTQHIKTSPKRSPRTTIELFLVKIFTGMSNKLLSTIFGISKSSVRRAIETVRIVSMRTFVPLYLGLETATRSCLITQHTRPLAKSLFGTQNDQLILVLLGHIFTSTSPTTSSSRGDRTVYIRAGHW